MDNELKNLTNQLVEMNRKSFVESFSQFKNFNRFNDFVDNCTKEGNIRLSSPFSEDDLKAFDINKSLWENLKEITLKQAQPKFDDVKLNLAIMFAYNLGNERVIATIKSDSFYYETAKKELIKNQLFEQVAELNNILNK